MEITGHHYIATDKGGRRAGSDRRGTTNASSVGACRRDGDERRSGEDRRKRLNPRIPVKWPGILERRDSLWRFHHFAWRMRRQAFRRCSLLYPPLYRGY